MTQSNQIRMGDDIQCTQVPSIPVVPVTTPAPATTAPPPGQCHSDALASIPLISLATRVHDLLCVVSNSVFPPSAHGIIDADQLKKMRGVVRGIIATCGAGTYAS